MARFGIGARVLDEDGDVAEVIGKRKGVRVLRYSGGKLDGLVVEWPKSSLVPANDQEVVAKGDEVLAGQDVSENACGWVPKVGDRVRVVKHCNVDGHPLRLHAPIGSEHTITELRNYFADKGVPTFILSGGGWNFYMPANVEPVVAPATTAASGLTVTAGGFYRTRDGRKVGPMVRNLAEWSFDEDVNGRLWHDNGHRYRGAHPQDDLVAEWVEPEVSVAVAEATATPAPKWQPTIGEKVRVVRAGTDFKEKHVGTEFVITAEDSEWDGERSWYSYGKGENAGGWRYKTSELGPVEPATPPAKFKVGDRVNYLLTRDAWQGVIIETVNDNGTFSGKEPKTGYLGAFYEDQIELAPTLTPGTQVTFTATGRLSAINENGHYQMTFPGLPSARNSFALPAEYVSLAN